MDKINKIIELCEDFDMEIISYGLAPNPNGFCFERSDKTSNKKVKELSKLLDQLTKEEERQLKQLIFGVF